MKALPIFIAFFFFFALNSSSKSNFKNGVLQEDTLKKGKNYILFSKTKGIDRVDFTKSKKAKEDKVYIRLGFPTPIPGSNAVHASVLQSNRKYVEDEELPRFEKIEILKGNYGDIKMVKESKLKNLFTITSLTFPVRLRLTTGKDVIDLELMEAGEWDISIEFKNN
jgi:hypothetical protein